MTLTCYELPIQYFGTIILSYLLPRFTIYFRHYTLIFTSLKFMQMKSYAHPLYTYT